MTAHELLLKCRQVGIALAVDGNNIDVDAPKGVLTPELRSELARHKPALVALLAPVTEFVTLKGGLTLPLPALLLALDLERRGFKMALDEGQQFTIEATATLTDEDRAAIRRWRLHLGAIVGYDADLCRGVQ